MKENDNSENRISKREKSFMVAHIIEKDKVYVTDISENGCQVFCEENNLETVEEGADIELKIEMPEYNVQNELSYISIKGKVQWYKKIENCVLVGLEFKSIDKDSLERIKKLVWYWQFLNSTFGSHFK